MISFVISFALWCLSSSLNCPCVFYNILFNKMLFYCVYVSVDVEGAVVWGSNWTENSQRNSRHKWICW